MLRRTALQAQRWSRAFQSCEKLEAGCTGLHQCLGELSLKQNRPHPILSRGYAQELRGSEDSMVGDRKNARVHKIADEILQLNLLELSDLTDIFQERLGIQNIGMLSQGGVAPAQGGAAQPAAIEAPVVEQTEFGVVLEGFDASTKIKVIKEIRALSELGLKEAKELVEKAPVTIKTGLKKEEAEELKKKLEAAGGKVKLE